MIARQNEERSGQLAISAGIRIFSKLENDFSIKYEYPPFEVPKPSDIDPESLDILNWIAMFFAQTSQDSAAVTMSKDSKGDVLYVHVSINHDKIGVNYRERAVSFLRCIHEAINLQIKSRESEEGERYKLLMSSVVTNCWPMIRHRLMLLKTAFTRAGGTDSVIKRWNSLKFSEETTSGSVNTQSLLKRHLESLFNAAIPDTDKTDDRAQDTRIACLSTAVKACSGLIDLHFIPDPDDKKWYSSCEYGNYQALDEIFRCLRSVFDYHSETLVFANRGIPLVRKEAGVHADEKEFQKHVKVIWVREVMQSSLKSSCRWDLSPEEWIDRFLGGYCGDICAPKCAQHRIDLISQFRNAWTKGAQNELRIHPEVELFYYLEEREIDVIINAIGTDSELCYACGLYFDQVKDKRNNLLTRPGSPNKVLNDWMRPPVSEDHAVGKNKWARWCSSGAGVMIRRRTAVAIDAYLKMLEEVPETDIKPVKRVPATGLPGDSHSIAPHSKTTADHPKEIMPVEERQAIGSSVDTHSLPASNKKTTADQPKVEAKPVAKRPPIGLSADSHPPVSHTKTTTDQHSK